MNFVRIIKIACPLGIFLLCSGARAMEVDNQSTHILHAMVISQNAVRSTSDEVFKKACYLGVLSKKLAWLTAGLAVYGGAKVTQAVLGVHNCTGGYSDPNTERCFDNARHDFKIGCFCLVSAVLAGGATGVKVVHYFNEMALARKNPILLQKLGVYGHALKALHGKQLTKQEKILLFYAYQEHEKIQDQLRVGSDGVDVVDCGGIFSQQLEGEKLSELFAKKDESKREDIEKMKII